jgi:restriction endonuclease S subunit
MAELRLLTTGKWNKPPVLTAARRLLIEELRRHATPKPLGGMAEFVNGTSYRGDLLADDGVPIIRISNITNPKSPFLKTKERFEEKYEIHFGDLLVSWSASFKSIIWPGPAGILNQHIFKVRENLGNDRSYIRHAIEAVFDDMQQRVVGIGMMHLRRQDFLGYEVPCPAHPVQLAVSRYLDWVESGGEGKEPALPDFLQRQRHVVSRIEELAANIEEAKELRRQALLEIRALPIALVSQAIGLHENDGRLGDVLCGKPRNGWSPRCNGEAGIPVLSLSAVTGFNYRPTAFKKTSEPTSPDAHYWLTPGDLLITRSNTPELVGHAAIYDGSPTPCIYPDLMMRLEVNKALVDTRFVHRWLMSRPVRDYIQTTATGTSPTMKKISQGTVMSIPFPTHLDVSEQRRIVANLDNWQTKTASLEKFQSETAAELDALMPSILSKAFRGEL